MLKDILYLFVGGIIGIVIGVLIATILNFNKSICKECGYKTSDKNVKQCPKCGNMLK